MNALVTTQLGGAIARDQLIGAVPLLDRDNSHWLIQGLLASGQQIALAGSYQTREQAAANCLTLMQDTLQYQWASHRSITREQDWASSE